MMISSLSILFLASVIISFGIPVNAADWNKGDVFAAGQFGNYFVYDNDGNFKEEIIAQPTFDLFAGCSFNGDRTKLYTAGFAQTKVVVFNDAHPHDIDQVIDTAIASPEGHSESVVFNAAGEFFVGHPDGNTEIHKYSPAGDLLETFFVSVDNRGTDWIDLSSDQCTLFYTSEGQAIQRYNVCERLQLSNFATVPDDGSEAFALRLLPPGDGSNGLLVAARLNIVRFDGNGTIVQVYNSPTQAELIWFALNLDPNGESFWSADIVTGNIYKFNIESGAVEVGPISPGEEVGGLCLKGELTAAVTDPPTPAPTSEPMTAAPVEPTPPPTPDEPTAAPVDDPTPPPTPEPIEPTPEPTPEPTEAPVDPTDMSMSFDFNARYLREGNGLF